MLEAFKYAGRLVVEDRPTLGHSPLFIFHLEASSLEMPSWLLKRWAPSKITSNQEIVR